MDEAAVKREWERNAVGWTAMVRAGSDVCRDLYNTPTFMGMLPDVDGLEGLDIGCGEGHNTRLLAKRGAKMRGVDIAETFVRAAKEAEQGEPLGIGYGVASGGSLPFGDRCFDFATAFMSFQDMPCQQEALAEAYRVLRPGRFFQFSIVHPCFVTPGWKWVTDEDGRRTGREVRNYFAGEESENGACVVEEWTFGAASDEMKGRYGKFRTPYFLRTLSDWLNLVTGAGFTLERFAEPHPSEEVVASHPEQYAARIEPYFLIIRGRKGERISD